MKYKELEVMFEIPEANYAIVTTKCKNENGNLKITITKSEIHDLNLMKKTIKETIDSFKEYFQNLFDLSEDFTFWILEEEL